MSLFFFTLYAQVTLSFLSMDVGPFAASYNKRREVILEKLKSLDVDVLCLQGVWDDKSVYSDYLKYSFAALTKIDEVVNSPCSLSNWNWKCINDCPNLDKNCARRNCPINDKCIRAILGLNDSSFFTRLIKAYNPFINKSLYAHQGNSGVLLLSKYPLSNITSIDFSNIDSLYNYSGVSADLELSDASIRITCNELPDNYENKTELVRKIANYKNTDEYNVFMGKYNFNPNNILKFKDYYAEVIETCDYCSSNSFNQKDEIKNYTLLLNLEASKIGQIFTEQISIDGKTMNISPHYPLLVQILFKNKIK